MPEVFFNLGHQEKTKASKESAFADIIQSARIIRDAPADIPGNYLDLEVLLQADWNASDLTEFVYNMAQQILVNKNRTGRHQDDPETDILLTLNLEGGMAILNAIEIDEENETIKINQKQVSIEKPQRTEREIKIHEMDQRMALRMENINKELVEDEVLKFYNPIFYGFRDAYRKLKTVCTV